MHNILRRAINHMETRDQFPDPNGHRGVETVMFNSSAMRLGKIDHLNFEQHWATIRDRVYSGESALWGCVATLHPDRLSRRRHVCDARLE